MNEPINNHRNHNDFLSLIKNEKRAKLKVYLGSAAGVGKTFAMLAEGHLLKKNGIDVAIGYLEPHDREDTIAKAQGLEEIPQRMVEHGHLKLREMDLEKVLERYPKVALVDELAHTNAPGSKNNKRYEDVNELLDAGINVITTLNIQHLESLCSIVEGATGIKVKERIPDDIVRRADQIVDVDLEAEDLIERLKAGKIYKLDKIDAALNNFFSLKNLNHLREFALSETANLLDKRQREKFLTQFKPSALDKVMVRIKGTESNPERLLRRALRLATQINGDLYAVHVLTLEEESRSLDPDYDKVAKIFEMARQMGAQTVMIRGEDNIPDALIKFVKANGITYVVQERPTKKKFWDVLKASHTDILIEKLPDVHIVMV
jgi:two-component system sensor histidine kinase KdpD